MVNRRKFLTTAGSVVAIGSLLERPRILKAAPQAATELGKVKIRDVKTASVRIKYDAHLVKVTTDSGLYGLGEAYNRAGVVDHIHSIKRQIIGQDPLQVDYLWHRMMDAGVGQGSRSGSLTGAISGIETALWDLAGKILNVPVYVLLGGKFRDKVLIYHDTGSPNTIDPRPWVEEAQRSKAYGFKAMKFDLNRFRGERWNRTLSSEDMKAWVKILEAIRVELGPDFPLGVDFHWAFNTREAMRFVQMVEHLNLWFLEDPMPPENADAFARLRTCSLGRAFGRLSRSRRVISSSRTRKSAAGCLRPKESPTGLTCTTSICSATICAHLSAPSLQDTPARPFARSWRLNPTAWSCRTGRTS
jgi:hypothetical protein